MKKSVLLEGILLMLVSASFISSAITITKEENKTYPTGRYVKFFCHADIPVKKGTRI